MPIKFFFPYIGNKWDESKKIYSCINVDKIKTIVEPFCGSCAFSLYGVLKLDIKDKKYVFNDIDKKLIDFLNDIKKGNLIKYIKYCDDNAQILYDDITKWHELCRKKEYKNVYEWYMMKKLSRGHLLNDYSKKNKENVYKSMDYEKYENHENFFMSDNVEFSNKDYTEIFEKYKNDETALLFLDPPYIDSYNSSYCGYNEKKHSYEQDNTKIYIDIIKFLKTCKCGVVMVISENALTKYLYDGYIKTTYEKIYQLTKKKTRHMIIYKANEEKRKILVKKKKYTITKKNISV